MILIIIKRNFFFSFCQFSLAFDGSYGAKSEICFMTFEGKFGPKVINWEEEETTYEVDLLVEIAWEIK
jgi:hypothetical protein